MKQTTSVPPRFTVIIPARFQSTRLPNKPLADIHGVPMVVRVAHQAQKSNACNVVVAGDDTSIIQACDNFGVTAILTSTNHLSGSDRLGEACDLLGLADDEIIVNVQGDEPLIEPVLINAVAALLEDRSECVMSSAACAIQNIEEFFNPNVVKVVLDARNTALYFSRAPIPASRNLAQAAWWLNSESISPPLRHTGIYAYRAGFLKHFLNLAPSPDELLESLEQLRVLWHGYRIAINMSKQSSHVGVDTQADLERVRILFSDQ